MLGGAVASEPVTVEDYTAPKPMRNRSSPWQRPRVDLEEATRSGNGGRNQQKEASRVRERIPDPHVEPRFVDERYSNGRLQGVRSHSNPPTGWFARTERGESVRLTVVVAVFDVGVVLTLGAGPIDRDLIDETERISVVAFHLVGFDVDTELA